MKKSTVKIVLDPRFLYRTPTGRLACWVTDGENTKRIRLEEAHFAYVGGPRAGAGPLNADFALTAKNLRILRVDGVR